jgi:hypothetical protein
MAVQDIRYEESIVRIFALVAAGVLLNFGLFFVLSIFAPLVIGLLGGFFFSRYRIGVPVGIISAVVSYSIIFSLAPSMITEIWAIIGAVSIMAFLGAIGAGLGVFLHSRKRA